MDLLFIAAVLFILYQAGTPAASPQTLAPQPVVAAQPSYQVTVPPPAVDESDATGETFALNAPIAAAIVQEIAGGPAPTGPPPIPTASSAYSAAAGYRGWTPQLAQANINALAVLSEEVNAGTLSLAQFQGIVQDPNVNGADNAPNGDPVYSVDSAYYSNDGFNPFQSQTVADVYAAGVPAQPAGAALVIAVPPTARDSTISEEDRGD